MDKQSLLIYHNAQCSKSRCAVAILEQKKIPYRSRRYIFDPLSRTELTRLLEKLNMPASAIVRRNNVFFKKHYAGKTLTEEEWLEALLLHPQLIERPIVELGDNAFIARPPENLLTLLKEAGHR